MFFCSRDFGFVFSPHLLTFFSYSKAPLFSHLIPMNRLFWDLLPRLSGADGETVARGPTNRCLFLDGFSLYPPESFSHPLAHVCVLFSPNRDLPAVTSLEYLLIDRSRVDGAITATQLLSNVLMENEGTLLLRLLAQGLSSMVSLSPLSA